jgi:hypothetical protein
MLVGYGQLPGTSEIICLSETGDGRLHARVLLSGIVLYSGGYGLLLGFAKSSKKKVAREAMKA